MEVFVLSFVVFVLSGIGLAIHSFFGGQRAAARLRDYDQTGDVNGCGGSCFCAREGADDRDPDARQIAVL